MGLRRFQRFEDVLTTLKGRVFMFADKDVMKQHMWDWFKNIEILFKRQRDRKGYTL